MPPTYFPLRWESTGDQWWYASPIDWAAANGHYDLVRELIRLDGNHLIKLTSLRRIRRLESVWDDEAQFDDVAKCRSQVARRLLHECETKKGKNSLLRAAYGGWLLYTAASAGDMDFVRELLERDPLLVFGEGEYGVTDILYAAARSQRNEVFKLIYDFALSPRFATTAGSSDRELDEQSAGDVPFAYKWEMMNRAVHAAARGGNLAILKELLADCSDVLALRDSQGSTVLHAAASRGRVEVVKDLLANYNIIESTDNHGNTALHLAAFRGQLSAVEALLLASPSTIGRKNKSQETFLHMAVSGFQTPGFRRVDRQIELMEQLVGRRIFKIDEIINAKNTDGRTALHLAIIGNVHSDLVELLMMVGSIDVNIRDVDGMTPLDHLRQRPNCASSEILTRQLISAGGISCCQDHSARRFIASHLRKHSIGGSPGTSFMVSDAEIFLYTGIENVSDASGSRGTGGSTCSTEWSPRDSAPQSPARTKKSGSLNHVKHHLKRLLHWPKMKEGNSERLKKLVGIHPPSKSEETPIPLRQRFARPSLLANNKRTLSVRSNIQSPTAKKKLASGLVHGVMQAIPDLHVPNKSRPSSFSKSSMSSTDKQKGILTDIEIAQPSCSSQLDESGPSGLTHKQCLPNKRLINPYFCFGNLGQPVKARVGEPHGQDICNYSGSVQSMA